MTVDKIPHKLLVKLYKKTLARREKISSRIEELSALDKFGFLTSCYNENVADREGNVRRILEYLNDPGRDTWDRVYRVKVTKEKTFWQVWTDFDPSAPSEVPACESVIQRWPKYPDPQALLTHAFRELKSERDELVEEKGKIDKTIERMHAFYPILARRSVGLNHQLVNER